MSSLLGIDTNLLYPAVVPSHPQHAEAVAWLNTLQGDHEVALSEWALAELYGLLRNPALLQPPLGATQAAQVCQGLRAHPLWQVLGLPQDQEAFFEAFWAELGQDHFPRRRVFDARMGISLLQQGVTRFATQNLKDFEGIGFAEVFNPLA